MRVHSAKVQIVGAIGSAAARVMAASVANGETLGGEHLLRIVGEPSQLRHLSEQLESLNKFKDDFMSSVTHEGCMTRPFLTQETMARLHELLG